MAQNRRNWRCRSSGALTLMIRYLRRSAREPQTIRSGRKQRLNWLIYFHLRRAKRCPFIRLHAAIFAQHHVQAPKELLSAVKNETSDEPWQNWLAMLAEITPEPNEGPNWREQLALFRASEPGEVEIIREPFYEGT